MARIVATPQTAPAGTRVFRWRPLVEGGRVKETMTVHSWITDDIFHVVGDSGGSYSGPTFQSYYVES